MRTALPWLLVPILLCGADCCGSTCSTSMTFQGPVPNTSLAAGDTTSLDLLDVWSLQNYCGGGTYSDPYPPGVSVQVDDPAVASASVVEGRLRLRARRAGTTRVVLRAQAEVNCTTVLDATHFTLTVTPAF